MHYLFPLLLCTISLSAQEITYEPLSPLPEAITNNAVTAAEVNGEWYVYTFTGLASGKGCNDDHLRAYRYRVSTDVWEALPDVPDPLGGKIAASASTLKGLIYVVGGYHLATDCSETSSEAIHRFDPVTNTWLPDGAPLLRPIDDQVQSAWRDSLLYVVTGWSNNGNVGDVQIYNPSTDSWTAGTPVPLSSRYRVFGGAGTIIGDTIYYVGGAAATAGFPARAVYRKGIIDPDEPTQITWSDVDSPAALRYRSAAVRHNGLPVWIGGSAVSYNFDGIAYNGSGGVAPLTDVCIGTPANNLLTRRFEALPPIMDLRGIAEVSNDTYIVVGGMDENQTVRDEVGRIQLDMLTSTTRPPVISFTCLPNPADTEVRLELPEGAALSIYNGTGQSMPAPTTGDRLTVSHWPNGIYLLHVVLPGGRAMSSPLLVAH